jgi:transketolase
VGVGEDGPTHEPVETVAALRAIPGLDVIRPADPEETAGAFAAAFEKTNGPTMLVLTRQNLPTLNEVPVQTRREGVFKGGYIAKKESAALETILLASGSEVQHAMNAAGVLGAGTRVVSMPCFERFEAQSADPWFRYVGLDGKTVAIDRFGLSAPGNVVMEQLGITAANLVDAAKSL